MAIRRSIRGSPARHGRGTGARGRWGAGVAAVLARAAFVRTLGGVEAYLALRARAPWVRAADVPAAVDAGLARVIPAVRPCGARVDPGARREEGACAEGRAALQTLCMVRIRKSAKGNPPED